MTIREQEKKHHPFISLVIILLLLLPPLLVKVGVPSPTRIMETLSFFSSQETWLHIHEGNADAWKMPTINGVPRIQKPPLLVWLNLCAWKDLTPENASVDTLVLRSRLLAVGLALLSIIAVYWMGFMLRGQRLATLSSLMTGTAFFFIRQARYASYDTHIMGWATLAVAGGVWGIKTNSRLQAAAGWILCIAALSAANLTKGPLGFILVLLPLLVAMWIYRNAWKRNILGLTITTLLSALIMVPWFQTVARNVPDAVALLDEEYRYIFEVFGNPFFYLSIFGVVFPWSLWLIAGTIVPFFKRNLRKDPGYLFAWGWFLVLLITLSLSPVKNKRYIVPLLPAAGLLTAYFWVTMETGLKEPGDYRWLRVLRQIHWAVLIIVSLLLPVFIIFQNPLLNAGIINRLSLVGIGPAPALITGAALFTIAFFGLRAHREGRLMKAAELTALWMIITASFGYYGYAQNPRQFWPHRAEAEELAHMTEKMPIYFISHFKAPYHQANPGDELLIYYRGIIPKTTVKEVRKMSIEGKPFYLMTRMNEKEEKALADINLTYLRDLDDGHSPPWKLFTYQP